MLTRRALVTVLQSLLGAELLSARGRGSPDPRLPPHLPRKWPETIHLGGANDGLGCDSLERLWLASAVNEMFHLHEVGADESLLQDTTFGQWVERVEAAWRGGVTSITFATSGTTGQPKRCVHPAAFLLTEAEFLAQLFRDRRRIASLLPAHHAYGFLFAALLPDVLGVDHVDATHLSAGGLTRSLSPGDLVVTFPERWRWLERSLSAWPEDVEGVVSTAPCPPELIAALHERGLSVMTEVYGSSETAGVAVRRWPDTSYRLMPHWRLVEPVSEDAPEVIHRSGLRIALPDRICPEDRDRFQLSGRRDGAVQVGGVNVYPNRVEARLRERPNVRDAAVRLMRPEEGTRLKAFVVPTAGADPTELRTELHAWIDSALSVAERPVALSFGLRLPTGVTGKAVDW